jgi:serine/threonine protein kinase/tetratricopeptide (TPR) repeat protein
MQALETMTAAPSMRPCPQCGTACEADHQYCPGCGFPVGSVVMDHGDKLVGQTLPGGYQILDLISVGGMGRVYRAEQRALGRTVAVKVIHPHLLCDENSIVRFMTEARAASQLNHPNSVSVIDFGKTQDGQPYLVMEFLRGKDLARVSYEQGPLPFKRIADVLQQVLRALSEAHDLEIVHRDLKPENIILEPLRRGGDFVKVVDFGLAKLKADATTPGVTMPGIVCGTPDYMAPEQGRGDPIDGRSDLYGVGVMLFQLLTGRLPFESENPTQVVLMHLSSPVPDPTEIAPERHIPEPLVRVVQRALQKNAEDRYQDALEFADALAAAMEETNNVAQASFTSIRVGGSMECPACAANVPVARFCCDCGERLPTKTERPTSRLSANLPPLPLRLYAREEDLAWLEAARSAETSKLRAYRIVGEAGMGKTRLLEEFLEHAGSEGDVIVRAAPDPYGAEVALYTLRQAIYGLIGVRPGTGSRRQWRDAREEEQRGLTEIFGSESSRPAPSAQRREDIDAAFRWALERAISRARGMRVILAIEDLDRVDTASLTTIGNILRSERTPPQLLLVVTHPPLFDPNWGEQAPARTLNGLPTAVMNRLLGNRPSLERQALQEVGKRGVLPLYVDQVVRFMAEGGSEPPQRLADLIAHRIGTLQPKARQLLQALAVLGERADEESLRAVLGQDVDVAGALDLIGDGDMIERSEDQVVLRHPLFREVILLATPAGVRVELHRRTIRWFDKQGAPIEARALHAYHSQESFEALLLLEQIAERAMSRGDEPAAVNALRRGLELSRRELYRGELDDPVRAMAIFGRKLGDALSQLGNFADAEGVLREALDNTGPAGTDRAQILASLARVARGRQRKDEAVVFLDEAIQLARRSAAHGLVKDLTETRRLWT